MITDLSISRSVAESFPDFDREQRRAGTLLIGALGCGTSYVNLRAFTGVPWHSVNRIGWYLRRAGVWCGQTMRYPWLEPYLDGAPEGELGFTLDVLVGVGDVDCIWQDGERMFQLSDHAQIRNYSLSRQQRQRLAV